MREKNPMQLYKIGDTHENGGIVFSIQNIHPPRFSFFNLFSFYREIKIWQLGKQGYGIHGKVCHSKDLGMMEWADAFKACEHLGPGWYLPSSSELDKIYRNLHIHGLGGFQRKPYWASRHNRNDTRYALNFYTGFIFRMPFSEKEAYVRAVREF